MTYTQKFLKELKYDIVDLTNIRNLLLKLTCVLDNWKTVNVTPAFRKWSRGGPGNCRVVSLTVFVPKRTLQNWKKYNGAQDDQGPGVPFLCRKTGNFQSRHEVYKIIHRVERVERKLFSLSHSIRTQGQWLSNRLRTDNRIYYFAE